MPAYVVHGEGNAWRLGVERGGRKVKALSTMTSKREPKREKKSRNKVESGFALSFLRLLQHPPPISPRSSPSVLPIRTHEPWYLFPHHKTTQEGPEALLT